MAHSTIVVKKTNQYQICDILQQKCWKYKRVILEKSDISTYNVSGNLSIFSTSFNHHSGQCIIVPIEGTVLEVKSVIILSYQKVIYT